MRSPEPFPWQRAIGLGLGVLRLDPAAFWKLTPRELSAALRAVLGEPAAPLGRASFDAMMTRFPDG